MVTTWSWRLRSRMVISFASLSLDASAVLVPVHVLVLFRPTLPWVPFVRLVVFYVGPVTIQQT